MENIVNRDDKSYDVILTYIQNSVNRIIGKYYNRGYINVCLYSKISSFFKLNDEHSLKLHKLLGVPTELFGMEISTSADLNSILKSNPSLKLNLKLYGMNVMFYTPFDTKEDKVIKNLIINHFVSNDSKNKNGEYCRKYLIESDIMKQLELIFGEETLALTLTNGSSYLAEQIDLKCSKKGLGNSVIKYIVDINNKSKKIKDLSYKCDLYYNSIKRKLDILMSIVSYNHECKNILLQYAEDVDFNLSSLSKKSEFRNVQLFSNEEILLIKRYISEFDSIILPSDNEYTWLDKVVYMSNRSFQQYQSLDETFYSDWKELNRTILYEIIPRYVRKNKKSVDLDRLITLAPSSLKNKCRTKLLQRRINRVK